MGNSQLCVLVFLLEPTSVQQNQDLREGFFFSLLFLLFGRHSLALRVCWRNQSFFFCFFENFKYISCHFLWSKNPDCKKCLDVVLDRLSVWMNKSNASSYFLFLCGISFVFFSPWSWSVFFFSCHVANDFLEERGRTFLMRGDGGSNTPDSSKQ